MMKKYYVYICNVFNIYVMYTISGEQYIDIEIIIIVNLNKI